MTFLYNGSYCVQAGDVEDAIRYLADLDRVYSEQVRPRFGKRSSLGEEAGVARRGGYRVGCSSFFCR